MPLSETGQVVTTCGIARAMRDDYSFLLSVRECLDRHCRATGKMSGTTAEG